MDQLETLLEYLVRNAYIIVSKDGTPFWTSGKKASKLLIKHVSDVMALNIFGDFVLFMGRIFVVVISGFVGYEVAKVSVISFPHKQYLMLNPIINSDAVLVIMLLDRSSLDASSRTLSLTALFLFMK